MLTLYPTCHLRFEGCTTIATEDDHVIPKAEGGTDDLGNRRGACHHCHKIKASREAARGRARARSGTQAGNPSPPF